MCRFGKFLLALALSSFVCASADAQLINGGFETGTFPPWTTIGTDTVTGTFASQAPAEGSFQAVISTPPLPGTVTQSSLETFLELNAGTLDGVDNGSVIGGGSAFKQTFTVQEGQSISFFWDFIPNGSNAGSAQNDTGFFTLHEAGSPSSTITILATTGSSGGLPTGYQRFETGQLTAGSYLLGFAAYDASGDGNQNAQNPDLLIDNVQQISCTPPPDNMISWWPGDGNAHDIQGENDGTINGATFAAGKVGQAFSFDGTNDYVNFGNPTNLQITTAITVDAWISPDTAPDGVYKTIASKWSQTVGNSSWGFFLLGTGGGTARVDGYITNASSGTINAAGGVIPVGTGVMTHVAMSYSAVDGLRIYVNGVQVGVAAGNGNILNSPSATVQIGNDFDFTFNRWFDGLIDEVEIFDRVLGVAEIQAIYNAGSAGKCRPCVSPPENMVSWWPGDGNARDIWDGNNGTLVNGATFAAGKVGQAFSLNGSDQYVSLGNPANLQITGAITLDAWVNPDDFGEGELREIISKWGQNFNDCGLGTNADAFLFALTKTGGVIRPRIYIHRSDLAEPALEGGNTPAGVFSHVATTYDAATGFFALYVNGVEVASATLSPLALCTSDENVLIGAESNGGFPQRFFPGRIDEVEIFNRALSQTEIQAIYDAGGAGKCKPAITLTNRQFLNISGRADVGTGANVAIGGFIIRTDSGTTALQAIVTKTVLIRGIGPSLPFTGTLANPTLELRDTNGALIKANDDWGDADNATAINDTGLAPDDPLEAAILASVAADSNYTATLRGASGGMGIGLVEVYDLESGSDSHLVNISTRALVGTGRNVLIGGFIVSGGDPSRVVVRAIGPSMASQGVSNVLADPTLDIHNAQGTMIAHNDDWMEEPDGTVNATRTAEIIATGLEPNNASEAAILLVPNPGNYTAIVSGVGGTGGIGLVEAYNIGPPPP